MLAHGNQKCFYWCLAEGSLEFVNQLIRCPVWAYSSSVF